MKEQQEIRDAQLGVSKLYQMTHLKDREEYLQGVSDALEWVLGD